MDDRLPPGFTDMLDYRLIDALTGRRSRRVFPGAEIPDGYFQYQSPDKPMPLSELEQMALLTAMAGNTGWHNLIMRNAHYVPYIANYAGAAGGRALASAAGLQTSEIFFTDDNGIYIFQTRDAPDLAGQNKTGDGIPDFKHLLDAHRPRVRKITSGRMQIPPEPPHMEGHNTWSANRPGCTLFIPVGDLAQHVLASICYYVQNGVCIRDDVTGKPIEGLEQYGHLVDLDNPVPLTFMELWSFAELTTELSMACINGTLTLQAMGLGGWMYGGLNPWSVLGASGKPEAPGLGFRYDTDDRWPFPNPTGLPGVFEGYCPPHYRDMRDAVEALARRKFGPGGPFHPDTPGPYKDTRAVRSRAQVHSEEFKDCVALMAQHIYDRFGKFPGTVPSILVNIFLQAQHLELEFYDKFYTKGAYLPTHERHMERWHPGNGKDG